MSKAIKIGLTSLAGAFIIEPVIREDIRGHFFRFFCHQELETVGWQGNMVQANQSLTKKKGTVRGMHYQLPPASEDRLVRCIRGRVFDVALDLRQNSETFLCWTAAELSPDNGRVAFIPKGCAHGFQALEDNSEVVYLVSNYYDPFLERGVKFDDPSVSIQWPLEVTEISEKDRVLPLLSPDFQGISL